HVRRKLWDETPATTGSVPDLRSELPACHDAVLRRRDAALQPNWEHLEAVTDDLFCECLVHGRHCTISRVFCQYRRHLFRTLRCMFCEFLRTTCSRRRESLALHCMTFFVRRIVRATIRGVVLR